MDAERLIGSLIHGALSSKKKRKRGALRFLTGGRNSFLNASTLLTAAGVVWGLFESAQEKTAVPDASSPFKGKDLLATSQTPASPSLERQELEPTPVAADPVNFPPPLLRLVRLTISAARADCNLSQEEKDQILDKAREVNVEAIVHSELQSARPLSEIVSGVNDPDVKSDLYTLAFTIVRADEGVSGAERIYLAQLANYLGLDSEITSGLERDAIARIEEETVK